MRFFCFWCLVLCQIFFITPSAVSTTASNGCYLYPPISVQTDAEMRKLVVYVSSIAIGMCLLTTVVHCVEHTTAHNANKFAQCLKCR